jgi:hypothetical protein
MSSYQFSFLEEFLVLSCSKSVQVLVVLRSLVAIALAVIRLAYLLQFFELLLMARSETVTAGWITR